MLAPRFGHRAAALGVAAAELAYEPESLTVEVLEARLESDAARGVTSVGPHLRDVRLAAGGRELRSFGSQGEQRIGVLALVLAEADAAAARREAPPLLLLDDVLSELDDERRRALLASLPAGAQTIVTATSRDAVPRAAREPELLLRVKPGVVERV
jgi:DNA replication and repair protein RecF